MSDSASAAAGVSRSRLRSLARPWLRLVGRARGRAVGVRIARRHAKLGKRLLGRRMRILLLLRRDPVAGDGSLFSGLPRQRGREQHGHEDETQAC